MLAGVEWGTAVRSRGAVGLLALSCIRPGAFSCEDNEQCRQGGERGICVDGHCAFEDPTCASNYAFAQYAGKDSRRCVPEAGTSAANTTGTSADPSLPPPRTTSTTDAAISGSGTESTGMPECGGQGEPCCTGDSCDGDLECNGFGCSCIRDVFAGRWHSCAVTTSDELWCWGRNDIGSTGRGATEEAAQPTPARVEGIGAVVMATAHSHTCSVSASGDVMCWGDDAPGMVTGTDAAVPVHLPIAVPWAADPTALETGNFHTCVSFADDVQCWGDQSSWGFGDPAVHSVNDPNGVLANIEMLGGGGGFYCALDGAGDVWCWGADGYGQLGNDEPRMPSSTPAAAMLPGPATALSVGGNYACALLTGDQIACWGQNACGELGAPEHDDCVDTGSTVGSSSVPRVVDLPVGFVPMQVEAFAHVTCTVGADGGLLCWGDNRPQQFLGAGGDVAPPTDVLQYLDLDESGVADVGLGLSHVCVLTRLGAAWCWGRNDFGQLGLPDTRLGFDDSRVEIPCE